MTGPVPPDQPQRPPLPPPHPSQQYGQQIPTPHGQQMPAPTPYPQQAPYGQPYPQPVPYQHTAVASTGLPGWMHVLYAIGGIPTCGLLWAVWAIHWWFAQSKTKSQTSGYR